MMSILLKRGTLHAPDGHRCIDHEKSFSKIPILIFLSVCRLLLTGLNLQLSLVIVTKNVLQYFMIPMTCGTSLLPLLSSSPSSC